MCVIVKAVGDFGGWRGGCFAEEAAPSLASTVGGTRCVTPWTNFQSSVAPRRRGCFRETLGEMVPTHPMTLSAPPLFPSAIHRVHVNPLLCASHNGRNVTLLTMKRIEPYRANGGGGRQTGTSRGGSGASAAGARGREVSGYSHDPWGAWVLENYSLYTTVLAAFVRKVGSMSFKVSGVKNVLRTTDLSRGRYGFAV